MTSADASADGLPARSQERQAGTGTTEAVSGTGASAAVPLPGAGPFDWRVIWVGGVVFAVLMALSGRYGPLVGADVRGAGVRDRLPRAPPGGRRAAMKPMAAIPQSTRDSVTVRLLDHAGTHWP
jgi:hypothetical protein